MAQEFTEAVVGELRERVAARLGAWRLGRGTSIRVLSVSENATFLLEESGGRVLVLRVHRCGYSSAAQIRSELMWLGALRRDGVVDTALPVPGADGECVQTLESQSGAAPRLAVAFEHVPGREPAAGDALPWFERLGEVTARLHRHARSWVPPAGFTRKRWDLETMLGSRAVWGPWSDAPGLEPPGQALLARAVAALRLRLQQYGTTADNFGLIHADLRLANLLAEGSALRVIDFDDCGFGWLAYDFAASVSFIEHEAVLPELLAAWCRGHRRVAPLGAAARAELPTFVLLRRILLTAWLASHAEVPFARECGPEYTAGTVMLADEWLSGRFLRSSCND